MVERQSEPENPIRGEITRLLSAWSDGDRDALDRLVTLVYDDLRRIARRRLQAERPWHTLDTTGVVHEAYLKLVDQEVSTWRDRAHFFGAAARVIRTLLIDHARTRNARKRGGGAVHIPLHEDLTGEAPRTVELLALEEALTELAKLDERLERVVECRYFAGMSMKDTAEVLGVSVRTAERDWTRARTHLYRALATEVDPTS